MNFNFNLVNFVRDFLPIVFRKNKILAFFLACLSPFERIKNEFNLFVELTRYNLKITGQNIVLETYLNKKFDFSLNRIYLQDLELERFFIWFEEEGQDIVFVGNEDEISIDTNFVYFEEEQEGLGFDFRVNVPIEKQPQETQIKAEVNSLKLTGKKFEIVYF